MHDFKIVSLGIKHIEIFAMQEFLYLYTKLNGVSIFVPYLIVLIVGWQWMKKISFSIYINLNFLWKFHCNLNLNTKCQNSALALHP